MYTIYKSILLSLAFMAFSLVTHSQTFVPTPDTLLPLYDGLAEWADLDNDGDLDIIYSGFTDGANEYFTKVYENSNGSFAAKNTALLNIRNGACALGDYDNDGDLDVLIAGLSATGNTTVLYENNGAFSFSLKETLPGLINSTPSWFDIDNDGDLDFLIAGTDDNTGGPDGFLGRMFVYENTGSGFTLLTGTGLPLLLQSSMDWADANGDGKIDLLITGIDKDGKGHADLYLNGGNKKFTKDPKSILKQLYNGTAKWGDFDDDGDLDAMVNGYTAAGLCLTVVYENIQGSLNERIDIKLYPVAEEWRGGSQWVDVDNDGLLDIAISGRGTSAVVLEYIFEIYKNKGNGVFEKVQETNFAGMPICAVDFGDFDNDGDMDFCYTGSSSVGPKSGIFENKLLDGPTVLNNKPSPPATGGFSERSFRKQVTLRWGDGSDQQTPTSGLSYNFYLGNSVSKFTSPASNFTTGYLLTANPANGHAQFTTLHNIPEGNTSWAVQSIDGSKAGSLFSAEKTFFHINGPEVVKAEIIDPANIKLTWIDNSSIETSYRVSRSTSPTTGFSAPVTIAQNSVSYTDNFAFLTDIFYYYRINASNGANNSAYDSLKVLIPSPPSDLLAKSINASRITLTWKDNTIFETGYEVFRKLTASSSYVKVGTVGANVKTYTDNGLSEGTNYDYVVRAVNQYGGSAYSSTATAQTNFRPLGDDFEKETLEDTKLVFTAQDFTNAFSDPDAGDALVSIMIETLPEQGTLKLGNTDVTIGQIIVLSALPELQFLPDLNKNGATGFAFFNNDGKDNSLNSYDVSINITPVNDPPDFNIPATLNVTEDFTPAVKVIPQPELIPEDEISQTALYTVQPEISEIVSVSIDPLTGELTFTSLLNKFGEAEFTVTADDGESQNSTVSKAIRLTVAAMNDAPVLSSIADREIEYPDDIPLIAFAVSDVDNPIGSLVLSAISDSQALVKNSNITIEGEGGERSIHIVSEDNLLGEALITLSANDGEASTTQTFTVRIFSVTGISENSGVNVKVFPNPFSSVLHVNVEKFADRFCKLLLHDALGREVTTVALSEKESTLHVGDIGGGIYMLSITGANGEILFRERVVKK